MPKSFDKLVKIALANKERKNTAIRARSRHLLSAKSCMQFDFPEIVKVNDEVCHKALDHFAKSGDGRYLYQIHFSLMFQIRPRAAAFCHWLLTHAPVKIIKGRFCKDRASTLWDDEVRKEALLGLAKSRPFMTYASKDDKRRSKSQLITDTLKELEYLERKVIGSDPDMENEDTPSMLDKLRRAKEYFTKMGGGNIAPQSVVS